MKVVFRADASLEIGTGHVMRCLTLADALRQHGAKCLFVCRAHPGNLLEQIRLRGYEVHVLPVAERSAGLLQGYAAWLGTDWETDAQQTRNALGDSFVDWLVVDHYALDARWEKAMRSACRHLMVIDDLADRAHECDLLLDQNLGRGVDEYMPLVPAGCTILVGPQYALLRPEFAELRDYSLARRVEPELKQLLITMGGVDKSNMTTRVLEVLDVCPVPDDCRITVVMGGQAPWAGQVRAQAARMKRDTRVLVEVGDIARVMAESDLAVGAGGSTAWERCCLGLPSLIIVLSANQQKVASALEKNGCALVVAPDDAFERNLRAQFSVIQDRTQLRAMRVACEQITQGKGGQTLARIMTNG